MPGSTRPASARKTAKSAARTLAAIPDLNADALDLDAISNVGTPYPVVLGGTRYELCDLNDLPIEIVELADTGNVQAIKNAIRLGLGDDGSPDSEGADIWLSFSANRFTIRQAEALFVGWLGHSGMNPGE
jgi:hypothetical protein